MLRTTLRRNPFTGVQTSVYKCCTQSNLTPTYTNHRTYAKKKATTLSEGAKFSIEDLIKQVDKDFGKGTLMRLGSRPPVLEHNVISTGSINLDVALGVGGVPRGRVTEIYGPESSGKTTIALHIIAEAQKLGGKCTFIDAEHAFDQSYSRQLGVNVEELLVNQPENGEQALQIADIVIKSKLMDVVVVDSVAALVPKSELEGQIGDHHIGLQARLMSQALRYLTASLAQSPTCLIFINQIRHKVGVMFGSPETTPGGNALKFYSSVRLDVRRVGTMKKGDEATGNQTRVTVVKNKLAPPFQKALFDIDFGKGISKTGEIVDLGVSCQVLDKSGAWYAYEGENIAHGRDKLKAHLEENPEFAAELEKKIREKLFSAEPLVEVVSESSDSSIEFPVSEIPGSVKDVPVPDEADLLEDDENVVLGSVDDVAESDSVVTKDDQ